MVACKKDTIVTSPPPVTQVTQTPVPNGDFENLGPSDIDPFLNWKTPNVVIGAPYDGQPVKIDSQAYHGKFSCKIVFNSLAQAWAKNTFATSTHPTGLSGYVKCNIIGPDTVSISIKLIKNKIVVDSGQWQSTTSITNFTQLNIPITHNASAIDTAIITLKGGKYKNPAATNQDDNTVFLVDYLSFY